MTTDLHAVEIALEDEVDDAGNGVRTVNGRVAARHDVDALNQVGRDRVDVRDGGRAQNVGGHVTPTVDQNQGALRRKAAKVKEVESGDTDAEAWILLSERAAQLGKVVQRVADVRTAALEELLALERGHGNDRFKVGAANASARNGNAGF